MSVSLRKLPIIRTGECRIPETVRLSLRIDRQAGAMAARRRVTVSRLLTEIIEGYFQDGQSQTTSGDV